MNASKDCIFAVNEVRQKFIAVTTVNITPCQMSKTASLSIFLLIKNPSTVIQVLISVFHLFLLIKNVCYEKCNDKDVSCPDLRGAIKIRCQ